MTRPQSSPTAMLQQRRPAPAIGPMRFMGGGMPPEKALNFTESTKRLLGMLHPERALVGLLLAAGVASVVFAVLTPKLLGSATDIIFTGVVGAQFADGATKEQVVAGLRVSNPRLADLVAALPIVPGQGIDTGALGRTLLLALGVAVASSLLGLVQGRLVALVVQRLAFRLREQVEAKLGRLPLRYFDQQQRGEVLSRATNDTDNIAQTLQQTMSQLVASLLTIVGVLVMMFWISPLLAVIALVTVPVSVLVTMRIGKKAQPQFVRQWSSTGKLNGHIEEMYTGHTLVKTFGQQQAARAAFDEHNDKLYEAGFRAQFISGIIQPAMFFIGNINYVLVAVVGGLRVASGAITLGDVQAFIQYSRQFTQPLTAVASMANLLQSGVASAERVFALLDAQEQEPDPATPAEPGNATAPATPAEPGNATQPVAAQWPAQLRGAVRFEDVSFRYEPERPLIEHLSLTAEPGQTVAIVGPTGAGKTTLVNLLLRFYEVTGGRITVDGVDIASMRRDDLRAQIGMVLQDTWLFGGTIAENIAYGSPDAPRKRVVAAAQAAHADRFIRTLPEGYDTVLDEDGSNLSAGEKQLLTIARAFLAEPVILVLDEATSSVDTRTEVLIQRAMSSLRSGRTSFVIAHRLSTIRDADVILVMDDGRIVEQGTHTSLVDAGGAYARLYQAQFAAATSEVS